VDEVVCWPTRDPMLGPVDATRERWPGVVQVAVGDNYVCGLVNLEGKSKVQCRRSQGAPTDVKLPPGFVPAEISAGTLHLCVRSESRELLCHRQGVGENWWEKPATKITGAGDVVDVEAGGDFVCATNTVGEVSCFLAEPEGLDEETIRTAWAAPRDQARIIAGVRGVQVAAGVALNAFGHGHACVVDAEQHVFCWGDGESGQLGRSELVTSSGPAEVLVP
jgi:alpha-tubulin suppressor-like RCC1 family protein